MALSPPPPPFSTVSLASASLYVGDLHPDVTDGQLFDAFSDIKSLASVRVCRDSATGRSLCYGYVNFVSPQDAVRAIELKNHTELNGNTMRVMWSRRDPDARKSGIGNLFVKNLSDSVDNVTLQNAFQKFGNIFSSKVVVSEDGKSKGHGFVQFESEDSANAAIENLNGSIMEGKPIYVAKFVKRSDRVVRTLDGKYTNLFVKNLDQDVTEEHLREKFSEFGKIASLVISKDDNGTSRGFGFVNFETPDEARKAMEATDGLQLGSKVLYVGKAQKKAEREQILFRQFEEKHNEQKLKYQGSNVYVKNIDDKVSEDGLRELFSQCGIISSAKIMRNEDGKSKGFGFVCFSNPEEANKAMNSFQGHILHNKPLYMAIAQKKEDRKAQLQLQFGQHSTSLSRPSSAFIHGGYQPFYYTVPPSVVPQSTSRPGLLYQPLGVRAGWRPNDLGTPINPSFQHSQVPFSPNTPRQLQENKGRMNGHKHPQGGSHYVPYFPHLQQPIQSEIPPNRPLKDPINQKSSAKSKYVPPHGRVRGVRKGSGTLSAASDFVVTTEMLRSMLAFSTPEHQSYFIGENLYPLVHRLKPELSAKITGMLLEMENEDILLLLDSPEALAAKVEEAVDVLNLAKTKESLPSSLLSAKVTVK